MDILYDYNEKAHESNVLQAIFNKVCIDKVSPDVRIILAHLNKSNILKNNSFLLLDKIRKIVAFK